MKTLLFILLTLALTIGLSSLIGNDTEYLVITIGDWVVQTRTTFFIILLFFVMAIFYFTLQAMLRYRRLKKQSESAERTWTKGLRYLLIGKWKKAEQTFSKGAKTSQNPSLNYLFAARAAQQQQNQKHRDHYLQLAHQTCPKDNIIMVTQAELQLNNGETEQALITLKQSNNADNLTPIKLLLLNVYSEQQKWDDVLRLTDELKHDKNAKGKLFAKKMQAYAGLLNNSKTIPQLNQNWKNFPRKFKREHYLIENYVNKKLHLQGATDDCEKLLLNAINRKWDGILVRLYGLIETKDILKQLRTAEKLLKKNSTDPALFLALGRLCIKNQLWGKATDYIQKNLAYTPNPEGYHELAKVFHHEGDLAMEKTCYQKGLEIITNNSTTPTQYHTYITPD